MQTNPTPCQNVSVQTAIVVSGATMDHTCDNNPHKSRYVSEPGNQKLTTHRGRNHTRNNANQQQNKTKRNHHHNASNRKDTPPVQYSYKVRDERRYRRVVRINNPVVMNGIMGTMT